MYYCTLRELVLYLHKDEHGFRNDSLHNAIRIHHALATKASDYTKKQHVFRLQTADQAEYLFQTRSVQLVVVLRYFIATPRYRCIRGGTQSKEILDFIAVFLIYTRCLIALVSYRCDLCSDSKELQSWIDTINFVCASFSCQPLAGAVGSQRKFQRPLLPCSHTKLDSVSVCHPDIFRDIKVGQLTMNFSYEF